MSDQAMAAYRIDISVEFQSAIDAFPARVQNELKLRIENAAAFPLFGTQGEHSTTIDVEGYKVILVLDAVTARISVGSVFNPKSGWLGGNTNQQAKKPA